MSRDTHLLDVYLWLPAATGTAGGGFITKAKAFVDDRGALPDWLKLKQVSEQPAPTPHAVR